MCIRDRPWGAGACRWARRARSAHAVRTCRPRRAAARACGGLGWRSSRASTEARRTSGRRERVSHVVGRSRGVEEDRVAARRPLRPTFRCITLRGSPLDGSPRMSHPERPIPKTAPPSGRVANKKRGKARVSTGAQKINSKGYVRHRRELSLSVVIVLDRAFFRVDTFSCR